jgi:hypothetical protein
MITIWRRIVAGIQTRVTIPSEEGTDSHTLVDNDVETAIESDSTSSSHVEVCVDTNIRLNV